MCTAAQPHECPILDGNNYAAQPVARLLKREVTACSLTRQLKQKATARSLTP